MPQPFSPRSISHGAVAASEATLPGPDVEVAEHLEVAHLDPLDPPRAAEVVLARVRGVVERVRVLGALHRLELALHALPLRARDDGEVARHLRDGRRAGLRRAERRVELPAARLRPRVEELAPEAGEREPAVEQPVEGEGVETGCDVRGRGDRRPLGPELREGLGARRDQLRAVEPEDPDRRASLDRRARDRAVLGEDEVLLGVVVPGLEEQRALVLKRLAHRPHRCAVSADGEARPLEALALGAARVEVLPRVGEPPVVVGAEGAVQVERAARGPEAVDVHRALRQRRLAVDALPGAGVPERPPHLVAREQPALEREGLLRPLPRRPLEERARSLDRLRDLARRERRGRVAGGMRRDHERASCGRCAAAFPWSHAAPPERFREPRRGRRR